MLKLVCLGFLLLTEFNTVLGHGYILNPPGRATAWRKGFNTPKDYTDNALNCGGFGTQHKVNGGKCGICGDPWNGPKENEAPGGIYATGTIVAQYTEGQVIDIDVRITTNHKGYFQFKMCENNNIHQDSDQSCFDKHILEFADGSGTKVNVGEGNKLFSYKLKLPEGVTCDQCVIQWHYQGGNDWGCDPDGTCCVGCGDQETFWGCSDIAITKGDDPGHSTPDAPTHSTPVEPTHTTPDHQPTTTAEVTTEPAPKTTEGPIDPNDCHSIPPYNTESDMDLWCKQNCAVGNCPSNMCDCAK